MIFIYDFILNPVVVVAENGWEARRLAIKTVMKDDPFYRSRKEVSKDLKFKKKIPYREGAVYF